MHKVTRETSLTCTGKRCFMRLKLCTHIHLIREKERLDNFCIKCWGLWVIRMQALYLLQLLMHWVFIFLRINTALCSPVGCTIQYEHHSKLLSQCYYESIITFILTRLLVCFWVSVYLCKCQNMVLLHKGCVSNRELCDTLCV